MHIRPVSVERFSVVSSRLFGEVVESFKKAVGRPDMNSFGKNVSTAGTFAELEEVVRAATGPANLMLFYFLDLGDVLRKRVGGKAPQSVRLVVGNPVIMSQMVEHVPDAGSYAPVTILIDERADGVHLSYDRMASFLAPYGNEEAMRVAKDLDAKVEALLTSAAG